MATSKELMMAILSMDAYNRGYNAGIEGIGKTIGSAAVVSDEYTPEQYAAGFYAVAYDTPWGKVISYRGTDRLFSLLPWSDAPGSDIWNGYFQGLGRLSVQARLAAEFYQLVTGTQDSDPTQGSAILTGHSMGGGLAGFVAALYGQTGLLFNNMAFEGAALQAWDLATTAYPERFPNSKAILEDFYNNLSPHHPMIGGNLRTYQTAGEFLTFNRALSTIARETYRAPGVDSAGDLHSMPLLVTLMYADEQKNNLAHWQTTGGYILAALFKDELALAAGFTGTDESGSSDAYHKMMTAIAYSAAEEGGPFGTAAIRALFNDAEDLGRAFQSDATIDRFKDLLTPIGQLVAQYAGQLAHGAISNTATQNGILTFLQDEKVLSVNLTKDTWQIGGVTGDTIVGREDLILQSLKMAADGQTDETKPLYYAMNKLWGGGTDGKVFEHVSFATADGTSQNLSQFGTPSGSDKAVLFITGNGNNTITGTSGNDMIIGGDGNDILYGGNGNDILIGGAGDDKLYGGAGDDYLFGGLGENTLDGGDGNDIYVVGDLHGLSKDTIVDSDGEGRICVSGSRGGLQQIGEKLEWINPRQFPIGTDGSYRVVYDTAKDRFGNIYKLDLDAGGYYSSDDLTITLTTGGTVIVKDYVPNAEDKHLGLDGIKQGYERNAPVKPIKEYGTPLVLDLDGNGVVDLIGFDESSAFFDLAVNGFARKTGWVAPGDGLLALDLNGNGRIDDLTELFGNSSEPNGFMALSKYDSNRDGVIDIEDEIYRDLLVWRDLNGDGISDPGELFSLASLGIISISYTVEYVDEWVAGNWISHRSSYVRTDGTTGIIDDVWFENNSMQTIYSYGQEQEIPFETLFLPELMGFGFIRDLSVAMTEDAELEAAVRDLIVRSASMSLSELRAGIEDLLLTWAGVDGEPIKSLEYQTIDGRHLAFIKAFNGHVYEGPIECGTWVTKPLEQYYATIIDYYVLRFLVQIPAAARFLGAIEDIADHPLGFMADITYFRKYGELSEIHASVLDAIAAKLLSGTDCLDGLKLADMLTVGVRSSPDYDRAAFVEFLKAELTARGVSDDLVSLLDGRIYIGTDGDDVLPGYLGTNGVFIGGAGNDIMYDNGGDDIFFYARGDGHDVIATDVVAGDWDMVNGDHDQLVFLDITPAEVELHRVGSHVRVEIPESSPGAGDGGSVLLQYSFVTDVPWGVEEIVFADGTVWTKQTMHEMLAGSEVTHMGSPRDDTMEGSNWENDVFEGGKGDDILIGWGGDDTYYYSQGDGHDTIIEAARPGTDRLIFRDIDPAAVSVQFIGNDVLLVIAESAAGKGDGGSVLLKGQLEGGAGQGIEEIVFAGGTVWTQQTLNNMQRYSDVTHRGTDGNDVISGTAGDDVIMGGRGDDILRGGDGNDTYYYARGDGNDIIEETTINGGNADRLIFTDIDPSAITLVRTGSNDVRLVIAESFPGAGDGGSVLLKSNLNEYYQQGVEEIIFADGTVWTRGTLRLALLAQASTDGDDVIDGFNVADVINAGDGNDIVNAGAGDDIIIGGRGDDILRGGDGNDTYYYSRGDGNDIIEETTINGGNADRLIFTDISPSEITLVRNGNDVTLLIAESFPGAGDGGSVLLTASLNEYYQQGVEEIIFADGTVWTRGTLRLALLAQASTNGDDVIDGFNVADVINAGDGNDIVNAGAGDDIITGGRGDDILRGGDGNDTYYYARGDGNDIIEETTINGGNADRLIFTDIDPSAITLVRTGSNDVRLVIAESFPGAGDGGSVLLTASLNEYYQQGVEEIIFADGTVWTRGTLRLALLAQASTNGDDVIDGFNVADVIDAGDGNDIVYAGDGDDIITGGRGDDYLNGGRGNDTYYYARGDGNDIIDETMIYGGNADRLIFTDISPSEITLVRNGNDVTLLIAESFPGAGDGGSVLLMANLSGYYDQGVEEIIFADGTLWDRAAVSQNLSAAPAAQSMASFNWFFPDDDAGFVFADGGLASSDAPEQAAAAGHMVVEITDQDQFVFSDDLTGNASIVDGIDLGSLFNLQDDIPEYTAEDIATSDGVIPEMPIAAQEHLYPDDFRCLA